MTIEKVSEFVQNRKMENNKVRISFKIRSSIKGTFIRANDFEELRKKNLWRIVIENYTEAFSKTRDMNLCRIFNGTDFKKLELCSDPLLIPGQSCPKSHAPKGGRRKSLSKSQAPCSAVI